MADTRHPSRTPRLVPGCNLRTLPIGPTEAFLVSRIDGTVTEDDLVQLTGFDAREVASALARLETLGAIRLSAPPGNAPPGVRASAKPERSAPKTSPVATAIAAPEPPSSGRGLYDPQELDEAVDLDRPMRRKILDVYYRLDEMDHYALLGLAESADKKAIKSAYYALAAAFHPDRYFRKNLGSFKVKMEAVFGRVTFAYETLSYQERRTEYDAYLATQRKNRAMEHLLASDGPPVGASEVIAAAVPGALGATTAAPGEPVQGPPTPPPAAVSGTSHVRLSPTPERERMRREAFARKLGGGRPAPSPARGPGARADDPPAPGRASVSPPAATPDASRSAMEDLRRRRDAKFAGIQDVNVRRYIDVARAAIAQNDLASAANAYRIALSLDPENLELQVQYQTTAKQAATLLADGYLKQGDYEARAGHWKEAARSYVRAAAGMTEDPAIHQKASQALVKSSGDLHLAADLAKRAVFLAPQRVDGRVILAEVYLAAGLTSAARRELEAAKELAPRDDRIATLLKKVT